MKKVNEYRGSRALAVKVPTLVLAILLSCVLCLMPGCAGNSGVLAALPDNAAEKQPQQASETQQTSLPRDAQGQDVQEQDLQEQNLQELIDNAGEEGGITIGAGTYTITEPLRIEGKKRLSIKGEGNVIILGENIDKQIFIIKDCGDVRLENIRARHKSSEGSSETKVFEKRSGSVVDIENTEKAVLVNCELEGCGVYGVYAENSGVIDIKGCYIHHNSWKALGLHGLNGLMKVSIEGCTITNNADFAEKEGSVDLSLNGENVIKFNNIEGYKSR